jgi:putative endonuclease
MARTDRRRAERHGRLAEWLAALYLTAKLYRILARRFRTPFGEIDLVAQRGSRLVFAEVKVRGALDEAAQAITPRGQRRISSAARAWLMRHPGDAALAIRFDVIVMAPWRWPSHITGAFDDRGERPGP